MAMLSVEDLRGTGRGGTEVLRGATLALAEGEIATLAGAAGCGASLLLRMVAGLEPAAGGRVRVGERDATRLPPAHRGVAAVLPNAGLAAEATVARTLGLEKRRAGTSRTAAAARPLAAAEALGLGPVLAARLRDLDAANRRRLLVARALAGGERLLALDDPLAGLDTPLRRTLRSEIRRALKALGVTALWATPDPEEAMAVGDRLAVMDAGLVAQAAPPAEVHDHPASLAIARRFGAPPINLLDGVVEGGAVCVGEVGFALLDRPEGTPVTVGIRPGRFRVCAVGRTPLWGRVELVERLGAEAWVHLRLAELPGERLVVVRAAPEDAPPEGAAAGLDVSPADVRLFDAEGRAVAPTPEDLLRQGA